ncbi:alpha/beta fold hydrolase [Hymenobacter metallicola]|uniref:Alpha/beta hydrolase n=1 Tax=Hymenobacter metallicola TaxID=2563114 RepID=A0A4Z0QC78_9BACT|nr:alpha/beta hydrolase [Hymenobacter metallicola]TGE27335.1 alpha/beta hydrolase [Hymenobacter metallicola]
MPAAVPEPPPLTTDDFRLPLDDFELQVRRFGLPGPASGPTLVLLHDSLGSVALWRDLGAQLALATGRPVLAYDRRGYGQSSSFGPAPRTSRYLEEEAETVNRVLAACGLAQAVLFGHSDGGTLALLAAALEPARIAACVTIGAHVFVEDVTLAGIREAQRQYQTTNLPQKLARYHGANTDAVFRAWTETWLAPSFRTWNIERYLPAVACPVLVLQGSNDEYGTAAQVEAIARQTTGPATARLLPGRGHSPHREDPGLVVQLTADFLNSNWSVLGQEPGLG